MSACLLRPARTSAASTPHRCTSLKSPYGYLYLALVCSDASSSMPRCQFAYSSQPLASMNSFSWRVDGWCSLQSSSSSCTTLPSLIRSCAKSQECLFSFVVMRLPVRSERSVCRAPTRCCARAAGQPNGPREFEDIYSRMGQLLNLAFWGVGIGLAGAPGLWRNDEVAFHGGDSGGGGGCGPRGAGLFE